MLDATSGQVNSSSAGRAHDGKADTMWRSGWYASDKFGGLNVPGVGLILDLGQQTEVRQVAVTLPVAQDVTVYLANRASVEGATVVGSVRGAPARSCLTCRPDRWPAVSSSSSLSPSSARTAAAGSAPRWPKSR